MRKRLMTVIAIIALGFTILYAVPSILQLFFADDLGKMFFQMQPVTIWSVIIAVVFIIFGIGRLKDYAATAGKRTNRKVRILINTGLFLLILPFILPMLLTLIDRGLYPVSQHIYPVTIFLNKTMVHFFIAVALFIWAFKTAWDNEEEMDDTPVFEAFISHFHSLSRWGWGFHIFLALLVAGSVFFLVDGMPAERPQDSLVTIAVPGSLNWDAAFNYKSETVKRNDTIKKIHLIKETRMLVTMADGNYGWYDIPFIKSAQGWNGYLFGSVKISDLKVSPDRKSRSIPEADRQGYQREYPKNTNIRILEVQNEPASSERYQAAKSYAMWARISVRDTWADTDVVGWIPYAYVRIHGQMHNSSIPWLWIPLKRLNALLGGGFFAGLANIILIIFLIPATAFIILKFISSTMRFIPNFFLSILLIITTLLLLFVLYFSFFDPSAFNWSNWNNTIGNYVYLGILLIFGFGIIRALIQSIYETRCPDCKYWYGYVYNRELLSWSRKRFKFTTTSYYTDGSSKVTGERYETHTDEDWKDSCKCGRCGYRWTLRRHEHEKR